MASIGLAASEQSARGHLAMLCFSALVAGSFSLGADAAQFIEPGALNAIRFIVAGGVVGVLAWRFGHLSRATFVSPWRYGVLGVLFSIYFVTMFEALKTVSAVSTAAVFTLTPFLAALFGWVVLRQRLSPRLAVALAIGAVGALWVIFRADLGAFLSFDIGRGELVFFVGCVAHALYPTAARALNRGEHPLAVNFGMLLAGVVVLVMANAGAIVGTDWSALPSIVWITILYTSIFAGATTFTLLQFAATRLPGAKVMAYTYLVPVWVVVWEAARGNALPGSMILLGMVLIAIALLILLRDDSAGARP